MSEGRLSAEQYIHIRQVDLRVQNTYCWQVEEFTGKGKINIRSYKIKVQWRTDNLKDTDTSIIFACFRYSDSRE
jgi:hypothetical protein